VLAETAAAAAAAEAAKQQARAVKATERKEAAARAAREAAAKEAQRKEEQRTDKEVAHATRKAAASLVRMARGVPQLQVVNGKFELMVPGQAAPRAPAAPSTSTRKRKFTAIDLDQDATDALVAGFKAPPPA
jgi:hypothetical protein